MTTLQTEINENLQHEIPKFSESPKSQAVFSGGKSDEIRSLEMATHPVRTELATLRGLQDLNPTDERAKKMVDLERQRGRIARYALLQKGATPEQREILKEKDTIEKLKASDLLMLKKKWVDLANLLLVPVGVDPTKSTTRDFIEKGEHKNFIVNFWENKNINAIIGAGDILPPAVNQIKITSAKYPDGVEGERKNKPRPGYYELKTGKYLPIYDGDKIEVVKMGTMDEKALEESKKADEEQINHIAGEEIREEAVRKLSLEEKKGFIDNATTLAKTIEEQYGIPWQVTVGQAALESGYGKSWLATKEGNYFGIKGSGKVFATREVYDGREVMENASFRTYSDMKESFIDYAKFLTKNPRYREAFQYAKNITPQPSYYPKDYVAENFNPRKFIEAIKDAGYATDPVYVDKIASVWKTNQIEVA